MQERPVLVAPDSFKGTFRAAQVAGAIGRGLERAGLMPPDLLPARRRRRRHARRAARQPRRRDRRRRACRTRSGREIDARLRADRGRRHRAGGDGGGLAGSRSSPRTSATPGRRRTYGTGQLIADAVERGAQVILVAVGGSATTDGGAGALRGDRGRRRPAAARGSSCSATCRSPWERCAEVFGPQKGADAEMVERLAKRLDELADDVPARPPRRADDRRRRRPLRRPVGRPRRRARAGRAVDPRRARLRRAHARRARRRHRRGQARRADAAGQARRRDRHAHAPGRRPAARDRRHRRARRVRQAHDRPPGA